MSTNKFLLIGAKPQKKLDQNPGGQLTASIGLSKYALNNNIDLSIIDTTQSSFPIPPFKDRLGSGFSRIKQLIHILKSSNIKGVIIFASSGFSFYERICMSVICNFYKVKSILFVRSGHFKDGVNASKRYFYIAKFLLKIPTYIGAQGQSWVDFYNLLGVNEKKNVLVRNWIPIDYTEPVSPKCVDSSEGITFVYVGWLVKEKGIFELLEAIELLYFSYTFNFFIVGGGTLADEVNKIITTKKMDSRVVCTGWQSKTEVKSILDQSHVFVLPSYTEGFPNALLEAMAMGLPAICTDVGGIADSLHNNQNGFLIPPRDPQAIRKAMEKYLINIDIIQQHSDATLDVVRQNHNWKKNCEQLFKTFEG